MDKKIVYLLSASLIFVTVTYGQVSHCGDGNQRYSALSHGDEIFYAGNSEDFALALEEDGDYVIKDTVRCRFGQDTLENIKTVRFLDKTLAIEDLKLESDTRTLRNTLMSLLLGDTIANLFGDAGYSEQNSDIVEFDDEASLSQNEFDFSNSVDVTSGFSNTLTAGNSGFGQVNLSGGSSAGVVNSSLFTNSNFDTLNNQNFSGFSNSGFIQSTQIQNPFTSFGSQSILANQSPVATTVVGWDTRNVGANDIVYFETLDSANNHYYLGSSIGSRGSAEIAIPQELYGETQIVVYIKSGTRVINAVRISLQ